MVLGLLTRLSLMGAEVALTAPVAVARRVVPAAGASARAAIDVAEAGVRATAGASAAAVRVGRVARNAVTPGVWRAGTRIQVPLRYGPEAGDGGADRLAAAARRVALALAEHPQVVSAYWDGGLARLVIEVTEDGLTGEISRAAARLAEQHGLEHRAEQVLERAQPDGTGAVRSQVLALACDVAGLATAAAGSVLPVVRSPRLVTAAVSLAREDSRVRGVLRRRLGASGSEAVLAAATAAAHGFGRSPAALVLDAALRGSQLVEALARGAAFDAAHESLCAPDRVSVSGARVARPAMGLPQGQVYADQAVTGSLAGAAGTLLFTRSAAQAADAVLAAAPKAARYGPAAFTAGLGTALARHGVLVRDPDRLGQLERVDTLVIDPRALYGDRRAVLEVRPDGEGWDHARLWHAATIALRPPSDDPAAEAEIALRPAADDGADRADGTRVLIASARGVDVGTVVTGWELDPLADAVLDAARQARLHVVVPDDACLDDITTLADEVVPAGRSLADTVGELRGQGRVVMTIGRLPAPAPAEPEPGGRWQAVLEALRGSDLAVAVVDGRSAVVWGADVLALRGLSGAWRLLAAIPAARGIGRRSKVLAQAGSTLSGLMVMTGSSPARRALLALGTRLSPVNAAAAAALLSGWRAAAALATAPEPAPRPRVPWHALRPEEALARLGAEPRARKSEAEAVRDAVAAAAGRVTRLPVFTPARLTRRLAAAVRSELDDPLTPVLAVGAAASAVLGAPVDALLVAGAMGMNALVGGVQRLRADRALASLAAGQRQKARRLPRRGRGRRGTVDAVQLSPGEVIELRTGDVVPADARLLDVTDLEVDESSLTGESLPVAKDVAATPQAPVPERRSMVFEGTTVVAGRARAVVVGTGAQTESGRAAHLASRSAPAAGVQARLHELTRKVLPLTLAGGAAVTALSLLRGRSVREAVGGGVAVAVAAVPEGLPLVATVAQMAAARRLSRRGVLVRTPRALEALGRMDTICFDKTGTLTENRLRVRQVVTAAGTRHPVDAGPAEPVVRTAARACPRDGDEAAHAHATDAAVVAAAPADPHWEQIDGRPFEASRGYACAVGRDADGEWWLVVKGAPEVVLPCCEGTGADGGATAAARALADEGLRILAVARRRLAPRDVEGLLDEPLAALELMGFVALADTPRAGSARLVADLRAAGVRPVMLTGDHPQTARAIALSLGWPEDTEVVTGDRLAALDRSGRARLLAGCGVIARVAPEQKLQVVEALREAGRVVAMVGDGANDAAAIRAADVGIGVAARGSAAARNAADLVLTGDELTPLVTAVQEGRALWSSVADAISILIGGNAGEVGFTVLGTLFSGGSPLTTRQLLLVNLLTDMFPAMAVAVTPHDDPGARQDGGPHDERGPGVAGIAALGEPLIRRIRQRGMTTALGAGTAWLIGTLTPGTRRRTSTMALCGLVGSQLSQTMAGRRRSPLVVATALGSAAVLVALVQTPGVSRFFGCTPLGPVAWAGVACAVAVASLGPKAAAPLMGIGARLADALPEGPRRYLARMTEALDATVRSAAS